MFSIVVISCLLVSTASAGFLGVPHVTTTQYHSQDDFGQYSYGYSGGPSAKEETRTADGVTRGSYSYVDANGIVQSASYVADPVHGFRVAATNLPQAPAPAAPAVVAAPIARTVVAAPIARTVVAAPIARTVVAAPITRTAVAHPIVVPAARAVVPAAPGFDHVNGVPLETPEVVAAKAAHFAAHHQALARLNRRWKRSLSAPETSVSITPDATVVSGRSGGSFSYSAVAAAPNTVHVPAAPVVAYSAPVASYAAPVVAYSAPASQYRSQDDFGQYSYGYSDGLSSKTETRSANGVTHGGYSYVDANGIVQSVKYVADAGGFRVHATNLPVGPSA